MADEKISELVEADLPLDGTEDVVLVQDGQTKRCSAQDIADLATGGGALPYKEYSAVISYNGSTFNVVPKVNTLGDGSMDGVNDIQWAVPANGVYAALMSSNPFTTAKLFVQGTTHVDGGQAYFVCPERLTSGYIRFNLILFDGTQTGTPNFTNLPIKILVYL